jgi:hypothetical protein
METVDITLDKDSSLEGSSLVVTWFSFIVMTFCITSVGADNFRIKICKPGNPQVLSSFVSGPFS